MGGFGSFELFDVFEELFNGIIDIFEDGVFTVGGIVALVLLLAAGLSSMIGSLTGLVFYVMYSLGIHRMAKRLDACHPVLAWIPFAQYFALGKVTEKCDERRDLPVKAWGKTLLWCSIGGMVGVLVLSVLAAVCYVTFGLLGIISLLGALLFELLAVAISVIPQILSFVCLWKIFREFYPSPFNIILFIVSLLLSIQPITVLIASFRTPSPAVEQEQEQEDVFA